MASVVMGILIGLQFVQVMILWLHDYTVGLVGPLAGLTYPENLAANNDSLWQVCDYPTPSARRLPWR